MVDVINKNKLSLFTKKDFDLREIWKDPTARSLLISNLLVLVIAIVQGWGFMNLLWAYFFQNLIIGLFVYFKILLLSNSNKLDNLIKIERAGKIKKVSMPIVGFFTASFFAMHYGFFHFIYSVFLLSFDKFPINWEAVLISSAIFFANHLFSFISNFQKDKDNATNQAVSIMNLMISAYKRIFPMHIIIIVGGMFLAAGIFPVPILILFVLLKTFVDIKMHQREHATKAFLSKNLENYNENN